MTGADMVSNPWEFGLTHALAILQICVTLALAAIGLRTFAKWRREKIEERKIPLAEDALRLVYKARSIFKDVRRPYLNDLEEEEFAGKPEGKATRMAQIRFAKYTDDFTELELTNLKLQAYFGRRESFFRNIETAHQEVLEASSSLLMVPETELPEERKKVLEAIAVKRSRSPLDEIDNLVEKNIRDIEELTAPVLTIKQGWLERNFGL
jgi:hypothetical protein